MYPELIGSVRAYPVFLALADLAGILVAFYCARRAGIPRVRFAAALIVLTMAAFLGAKAYGLIERGGAIGPFVAELTSGYRYPGGILGFVFAVWLVSRIPFFGMAAGLLADVLTPSFGFAIGTARIGCLLAGCCAGRLCSLPWAIQFPGGSQPWHAHLRAGLLEYDATVSLPVHPLQIYFALLAVSLGILTVWLQRRKKYDGQVFLIYVAIHGTGKFLLEFMRFEPLPHVQFATLVFAVVAIGILRLKCDIFAAASGVLLRTSKLAGR